MSEPPILSEMQRADIIRHVTTARLFVQSLNRYKAGIARVLACDPDDTALRKCVLGPARMPVDVARDVDRMLSTMGIIVTDHEVVHARVAPAMQRRKSILDRFFNTQDDEGT